MSDLVRPGATDPASPTAATLVRVLASVVDLVVTDHDPVGHEPAVHQAVRAAADALAGLVDPDPERTAAALDVLIDLVGRRPGDDHALFDRWQHQVRTLTPALSTARLVVSRLEAMVDELARLSTPPGAPAPLVNVDLGDAPEPAGPDGPEGSPAPGAEGRPPIHVSGVRRRT